MILLTTSLASAFCGTYVGAAGSDLTNNTSQVVLVRQGNQTVLNLAMDYQGSATDFALLLPLPPTVEPENISVTSPEFIEQIELYGSPRAVSYTCDSAFDASLSSLGSGGCGMVMGCSSGTSVIDPSALNGEEADGSVTVEAAFTLNEYDIALLSAEESADLYVWLDVNGYAVPTGGDAILQEYIDAGARFMAARISLDALGDQPQWLTPLQIRYTADVFSLPIRIGTISADGEQEVLMHILTDSSEGEVGIANYAELDLESECMWPQGEDFADFYNRSLDEVVAERGAGWVREYSWDIVGGWNGKCDPCPAPPEELPDVEELEDLGFDFGDTGSGVHLTRLRFRYAPEDAIADVSLYLTGETGVASQKRYIAPNPELEFIYPYCGTGFAEEPRECPSRSTDDSRSVVLPPLLGASALVALMGWRRRK